VFGDHLFDCRPRGQAGPGTRAVINEIRGEIHVRDDKILPVHEFLKMVSDKRLHIVEGHTRLSTSLSIHDRPGVMLASRF
jgi:hypothetical protein